MVVHILIHGAKYLSLFTSSQEELSITTMMPHPTKKRRKQRLEDGHAASADRGSDHVVTLNDLSVDVLADIFGFLDGARDIMQKRRVCRKWREAVKKTIVPPIEFCVDSLVKFDAMVVMTRAMPNLQQIEIGNLEWGHNWRNGEDPDEEWAARAADRTSHDIEIISNFRQLRILEIDASLNGRYPFLFNSFPLLEKLSIQTCFHLKWDLEMLAGLPLLKELNCNFNDCLTGNISNLRVLKDTLEKVEIMNCPNVEGNFMDLADFPHLKVLELYNLDAVTGDIRDIGENDFSSLEGLHLPKGVYGGTDYKFQHISDGPELIRAVYLLKKQRPALKMEDWQGKLSKDSPDWYVSMNSSAPFYIRFVKAGSRIGYRWETDYEAHVDIPYTPCEVNWLDPEPDKESSDYAKYMEEFQKINSEVEFYKGLYQPPTEEEYYGLLEEYADESDESDEELANEELREEWR